MAAGDDKRRAERQLAGIKAEAAGAESELKAARDALAAGALQVQSSQLTHELDPPQFQPLSL
jgi:hypothetical protein